ncbi:protein translocase subunit SecF [Candidatus Shapirobacteria bacterium]|nr:protein translocase subunit SecF [Candidatus Shapirobacteria bacterium]
MNIMKFRPLFLFISLSLLSVSAFSLIKWGFRLSSDFTGGSVWEVQFSKEVSKDDVEKIFKDTGIPLRDTQFDSKKASLKFANINQTQKTTLDEKTKALDSGYSELKYETIGPILGKELMQKTLVAIILSSIALLIFIGSKFKDFSFGTSAVLAMLHDAFILLGAFSLFGHFFGAELDALFVTALLTTLSASVHDTVVTFDRIRELRQKNFKIEWENLANLAVSEVIVRSINNSMTIIFMLLSLVLLGGAITKWFSLALLIGVICGTYSSIGVAIPIVLFWKKNRK